MTGQTPLAAMSDADLVDQFAYVRDKMGTEPDCEQNDVWVQQSNWYRIDLLRRLARAAAPPSGQVCVDRDDLELAIEWMDQTDNPWSGEAFRETWAASLVARDQLKDALHESYVTEGVAR